MGVFLKDLIGSSLPAVDGDQLDVTLPQTPKEPTAETKAEPVVADVKTTSDGALGLTLLQKVSILLILSGCVVVYVRIRKSTAVVAAATEKNLA